MVVVVVMMMMMMILYSAITSAAVVCSLQFWSTSVPCEFISEIIFFSDEAICLFVYFVCLF